MGLLLSRGNGKLDKSVLCWSIPPVKSCLNCSDCKSTCYARLPYNRWPVVQKAWDRNFELAKSGEFESLLMTEIKQARNVKTVRIHVAGDFFSQDYIQSWERIILKFPNIKFYTYTKVYDKFDFLGLEVYHNMNLINSIADDGKINYGDEKRVNELIAMGYKVCPATMKGGVDKVKCGKGCTICHDYNKVAFHQHK